MSHAAAVDFDTHTYTGLSNRKLLMWAFIGSECILFGTLMGMVMVIAIYGQFGFTRILGVGHILFWTPTLFYMVSLQGTSAVRKTWFGRWLWLAILVMGASLVLDYSDLIRYMFGDREVIALVPSS